MKNKKIIRAPFAHFKTLMLITLLLASSCESKERSKKAEESSTQKAALAMQEPTIQDLRDSLFDGQNFKGEAAFLNDLTKNLKFVPDSNAIPETDAINALLDFIIMYNNKDQNLKFQPIQVGINSQLIDLLRDYNQNSTYGLVFHYGYRSNTKNLVYTLSKGLIDYKNDNDATNDIISFCPFDIGFDGKDTSDYYLLFEPNQPTINQVDENTLLTLRNNYLNNIVVNRYIGDLQGEEQLWPAVDPQMIYFDPSKVWAFYNEHRASASPNDLKLYFGHGSLDKSADLAKDSLRHSPVLFFGDGQGFFYLDDVDYSNNSRPFRNKAFDAGRLCPPRCPSTAPSICTNS